MSGFGVAFRIGVELVAALIVGVGVGWLLDRWLGSTPWFLIVFFFLGAAAGILNVYRAASGIGLAEAEGAPAPADQEPEEDDDDGPAGAGPGRQ
jgi:ATP synthase protein I